MELSMNHISIMTINKTEKSRPELLLIGCGGMSNCGEKKGFLNRIILRSRETSAENICFFSSIEVFFPRKASPIPFVSKMCYFDWKKKFFENNESGKTSLKFYQKLRMICCGKENALSCITENQKGMHISLNKHFETNLMKKLIGMSEHIKTPIDNFVKGFVSFERKDEPFPNIENLLYNKTTSIFRFGNRKYVLLGIRWIFHDGLYQKKDFENLKEIENMLRIESVLKYESLKIREKVHLWINCSEPERMLETVKKRVPNWILLHQPFYITS